MLGRLLAGTQRSQQQGMRRKQGRWRWGWPLVAAVALGLPAALQLAPVDAPTLPPATPPLFRALSLARTPIVTDPAPYLGLSYLSVAAGDSGALQAGLVVASVETGSPAATAGIRAGDVLLAVDGRTVRRADSLLETLKTYQPNQEITLTIQRGGESWDIAVRLAAQRMR